MLITFATGQVAEQGPEVAAASSLTSMLSYSRSAIVALIPVVLRGWVSLSTCNHGTIAHCVIRPTGSTPRRIDLIFVILNRWNHEIAPVGLLARSSAAEPVGIGLLQRLVISATGNPTNTAVTKRLSGGARRVRKARTSTRGPVEAALGCVLPANVAKLLGTRTGDVVATVKMLAFCWSDQREWGTYASASCTRLPHVGHSW